MKEQWASGCTKAITPERVQGIRDGDGDKAPPADGAKAGGR